MERKDTSREDKLETRGRSWSVLAQHHEEHQHPVYLLKAGTTLGVLYGAEFHTFSLHEDLAALREYGHCVRHALECNGMLDAE